MSEIITREATINDLDTLYAFEQDLISVERAFDPTFKPDRIHYYDLPGMIDASHVHLLVAELEGKVIGSGYARIETAKPFLSHSNYAYLGFMYVLPERRNLGINQIIMEALKEWVRAQGMTELRLEVYHENLPAIKAYTKAGFSRHIVEMRMSLNS